MPISNQPTYQSALQVAMQAGQRRDNLQGMQMQAQQAGLNLGQNLLQLAMAERQIDQSDAHFRARMSQVDDHFGQQIGLARDQQEINKLIAERGDAIQLLRLDHEASQASMQNELGLMQLATEISSNEALHRNLSNFLGSEELGGMAAQGLLNVIGDVWQKGDNIFERITSSYLDPETGRIISPMDERFVGQDMSGAIPLSDVISAGQGQGTQGAFESFLNQLQGLRQQGAEQQQVRSHEERVDFAVERFGHLNVPPEIAEEVGIDAAITRPQEGHWQLHQEPYNRALANPGAYDGWGGRLRLLRDGFMSLHESIGAEEIKDLPTYRNVADAFRAYEMGDEGALMELDPEDWVAFQKLAEDLPGWRRFGYRVRGGRDYIQTKQKQHLSNLERYASNMFQMQYNRLKEEGLSPQQAYRSAMEIAHLPSFQRYSIYAPAVKEAHNILQKGREISPQMMTSLNQLVLDTGVADDVHAFIDLVRSDLENKNIRSYDFDEFGTFVESFKRLERRMAPTALPEQ